MKKSNFMKNVATIVACFAVCLVMSCCDDGKESGDDDNNGNGGNASSLQTWTTVEISELEEFNCICFANGKFVAGSLGKVAVSSDNGKTWVVNNNTNWGANGVKDIIYDGSRFVAIVGKGIAYTTDPGGTWARVTLDDDNIGGCNVIAYGGGYYIAAGRVGDYAYATNPAGPWSYGKIPPVKNDGETVYGIAYGNGKFITGSMRGKLAYTTGPTETWTILPTLPEEALANGILYDGSKFVFAASDNLTGYATDAAGPWTTKTGPLGYSELEAIAFGKGIYVAAGNSILFTSNPASGWTAVKESPFTIFNYANGVAFGNDTFIAVGGVKGDNEKGLIAYSIVK